MSRSARAGRLPAGARSALAAAVARLAEDYRSFVLGSPLPDPVNDTKAYAARVAAARASLAHITELLAALAPGSPPPATGEAALETARRLMDSPEDTA